MYELSEQDSDFLGLDAKKHIYMNLLLKQAYQMWYVDSMDECKWLINLK